MAHITFIHGIVNKPPNSGMRRHDNTNILRGSQSRAALADMLG